MVTYSSSLSIVVVTCPPGSLLETKPAYNADWDSRLQLTSSWLCFPKLCPDWAHHPDLSLPWLKGQWYYKPGLTHQDPGTHSGSTCTIKLLEKQFREVGTRVYSQTCDLTCRAPSADFLPWLRAGGLVLGCRHLCITYGGGNKPLGEACWFKKRSAGTSSVS